MFLFPHKRFLKFLVKSQPQHSYKKGSYKKRVYWAQIGKPVALYVQEGHAESVQKSAGC